jgi:hypothetical protein
MSSFALPGHAQDSICNTTAPFRLVGCPCDSFGERCAEEDGRSPLLKIRSLELPIANPAK